MSAKLEQLQVMEYPPWMLSYVDCFSPLDPSCSSLPQPNPNKNNTVCVTHSNSVSNNNSNTNNDDTDNNGGEDEEIGVEEKRLSHNARERDRRKKLNALYASLRSLLPASDHRKKLSIAATVSRVLKYIPEQRQEVEDLCRRKDEILNKISRKARQSDSLFNTDSPSSQKITPTRLSDTEIALQFTTSDKTLVSDLLLRLEETGLRALSFSSTVSSKTRGFYTLHLEMERGCNVKFEEVSEMLMTLQEKQDQSLP